MKNKTIYIYLSFFIAVTLSLVLYFIYTHGSFSKKTILESVKKIDYAPKFSYTGVVESSKITPIYIETSAIVEEVFVKPGSSVKKGHSLAKFSINSVFAIEKKIKLNDMEINKTLLKLDTLENGTSKLELDTKNLEIKNIEEQIKGSNRKIPILSSESTALRKRATALYSLFELGGISAMEANKASTEASKKEAELEDLKMNLELLKQKYSLTFLGYESLKRDITMQKMELSSDLSKLNIIKSELLGSLSEIKTPLKSPISGIVISVDVTPGSNITPGSRLFSIAELDSTVVNIKVPLSEISYIKNNQKIEIFHSENSSFPIVGAIQRISSIANQSLDSSERVVDVEISVPINTHLNIGFNATAVITAPKREGILVIDSKAVFLKNSESYLLILEDSKPKKIMLQLGKTAGESVEVLNLKEGQSYIINHNDFLNYKN